MRLFLISGFMFAVPVAAQDSPVVTRADRLKAAQDLQKAAVLQATLAEQVKNAPYSADASTTSTQTLADGNRIEQTTTQKLYRDSEGRERREESVLAIGALAQPNAPHVITINDPVAGTSYTLNPEQRTAQKGGANPFVAQFNSFTQATGGGPEVVIAGGRVTLGVSRIAGTPGSNETGTGNTVTKEDLGSRNIEGVTATGTRSTETIPAGAIGNVAPIRIVDETWYSRDLKMNVLTTHSDPRSGEVVYKLTNVRREEQPRSLFEVPPDYTMTGPGKGTGRGGRGAPAN